MIKKICTLFLLLIGFSIFAETTIQKELLSEYEYILSRIRYSNTSGFCFDGKTKIPQIQSSGKENTFYIEDSDVYLKVINKQDNTIYYTRHFELNIAAGKLAINSNYIISPSIKLEDHFSLLKLGNKLNVSICTENTCRNEALQFFKIKATPLKIVDGIFFIFNEKNVKPINSDITIILNKTSKPDIDITKEEKNIRNVLDKMTPHFNADEIKTKTEKVEQLLQGISKT